LLLQNILKSENRESNEIRVPGAKGDLMRKRTQVAVECSTTAVT
jgi:hypothetical protein